MFVAYALSFFVAFTSAHAFQKTTLPSDFASVCEAGLITDNPKFFVIEVLMRRYGATDCASAFDALQGLKVFSTDSLPFSMAKMDVVHYLPDASLLRHASELKGVDLTFSRLRGLDGLTGNSRLRRLVITDFEGESVKELGTLKNLETLEFSEPKTDRLNYLFVRELTKLRTLEIRGASLGSVDFLREESMRDVWALDFAYNEIADLTPILAFRNLRFLQLAGNQIKDVEALGELEALEYLGISGNPVSEESIRRLRQKLPKLVISKNSASLFRASRWTK